MFKKLFRHLSWIDVFLRGIQIITAIIILVGLFNTFTASQYSSEQWATLIFAGLAQGSIYALIALGYTLVYGILLMINFAHGEVFMAGAFSTVFLARYMEKTGFLDRQPLIAIISLILFSAVISMTVALLLERIAYRPLRNAPRLIPLITAIGASFVIQYTFRGLYGPGFQSYPEIKA
ncbi:MAG: branched-chain amino acid ABC transporter permease, partial [Anaerolineae bacterium]|nr:branched-chain amino acid ABC transporter permease [Anaerolineae bacterium]